jgi:ribosomal protein L29
MKTNDKKALRTKTVDELKTMVKETKEAIFNMKMDVMQSKEKNVRQLSHKRDDIARILTVIKEKEMENGKSA